MAALAVACAFAFSVFSDMTSVPVLGEIPLTVATIVAAIAGWLLMIVLYGRKIHPVSAAPLTNQNAGRLLGLGAILALPPIGIDLWLGFARDINVPVPSALAFYPAIALVAEVAFHLAPLALLAVLAPAWVPKIAIFLPVVFVEPLFQILFASEQGLKALLVFINVSLVSAAQLWLFYRYGFAAMIGLRLTFYLFWHVIWGVIRLI